MTFSSGFLNRRVEVLARQTTTDGTFGREGGKFATVATIWANVAFVKGVSALREGAYDAYDTKMVRCRYHEYLTRECRLRIEGIEYKIESLNSDRRENTMQIVCTELKNSQT